MKSYLGLGCVTALLLTGCGDDRREFVEYFNRCEDLPAGQRGVDASVRRAFQAAEKSGKVLVDDTWSARAESVRTEIGRISALIPPTWRIRADRRLTTAGGAPTSPDRAAAPPEGEGPTPRTASALWRFARAAFSVPAAHAAACPPANGEMYLLRVLHPQVPNRPAYMAILSVDEFIPDGDLWRDAMDLRIGQTLNVTVLRAAFKDGAIVQGPWASTTPASFLVTP